MTSPRLGTLSILALLMTTGCSVKDTLVGSWTGQGTVAERPFEFSSMTLAPDGTYTAVARYADTERALTGHWTARGGVLSLDEGKRRYEYAFKGTNKIVFTDSALNEKIQMERVQ
ncbi:MAG: hypothetical protein CMJ40_01320 [Phycisphaerae bacterium]|nr:hypothetical protein [Phycisphaerae bacterium]